MKRAALEPTCPVGEALTRLSGRWRSSIICALLDAHPEAIRFSELLRRTSAKAHASLSRKVLSKELQAMMEQGLLVRFESEASKPPFDVRYGLTQWGSGLQAATLALAAWMLDAPQSPRSQSSEAGC